MRILRFPVRAVLGVEPLWAVVVYGTVFVFLLFQLVFRYGLLWLLQSPLPRSSYILPLAYGEIALVALAMIWFAVALWRSATQLKSSLWRVVVRALAILIAADIVFATPGRVSLLQQYLGSPPTGSVMDSRPK